jgi:hypothetical protein
MDQQNYALIITKIECLHSSAESGHDDVYFNVFPNGDRSKGTQHYYNNTLKMNGGDDSMRYADISINATYLSSVEIEICDKDDNTDDDQLGLITINRDDPLEGSKSVKQTAGDKEAEYRLYWRVTSKPIPTLRILGIKCDHSSDGCNSALIKDVAAKVATCAEVASEVIGHVKTPRAIAMSKAFGAVADYIEILAAVVVFRANLREGADDVYLQHVDLANPDDTGGAFCPPDTTKYLKMNNGDEMSFLDTYQRYFRFPLDRGSVTIQIREGDMFHNHVSLGSITIGEAEYNALKDQGATVQIACEYLTRGNGQGAIYYLCYSVAMEDWAKDATDAAQGEV